MIKPLNICFILLLIKIPIYSDSADIGKVIQMGGIVERSSIITGKRYTIEAGSKINYAERLKLTNDSYVEILLENGTSIYLKDQSELLIFSIRIKAEDPPTKIKLLYGKAKIIPKHIYNDRTLILTTQTAIISIVDSSFSVIASEYETKILSHYSKVGIANINPGFNKAYILYSGEESSIRKDEPPTIPLNVPDNILKFWFDNYNITTDHKFIIKIDQDEGIIDWILRKRVF